jgi:phospholipase D1/2
VASRCRCDNAEHLGLLEPAACVAGEPVTDDMRPAAGTPSTSSAGTGDADADAVVADPLADAALALWDNTAAANTAVYTQVFKTVPTDAVRDWDAYTVRSPLRCRYSAC